MLIPKSSQPIATPGLSLAASCTLLMLCITLLMQPRPVQAQEIWQTDLGRACIEEWIGDTTRRLNSYSGSSDFEGNKPWRINQYGHFIGTYITQSYEPDAWWSVFEGDKYRYMWGALYQSEKPLPNWNNANFNGAGVFGMRWYVRACVARGGGTSGSGTGNTAGAGIVNRGGFACFGGAVYPADWANVAQCSSYGCYFGQMSQTRCLDLGISMGAGEVIHGNFGMGRSNECWLQDRCADLRPNPDFTYFGLPGVAPPPPVTGYGSIGGLACYGGATYPAGWAADANCVSYGCDFGQLSLDQCLALGDRMGAALVIHGNAAGGRANECWLQNSCSDLRPNADFTAFSR